MLAAAAKTIRKRIVWPIGLTLLGALCGLYLLSHQRKVFRSTGTIIIAGATGEHARRTANSDDTRPTIAFDQAYRIKSDAVLDQVIRDLDLMQDVSVQPGEPQSAGDAHSRLLLQLKSAIAVNLVPHTDLIDISYTSLDPDFSATLVNKVLDDFIQYTYQERFAATARSSQFPATQLARLKEEMQATEQKMIDVERRVGNTGFNSDYNKAETNLTDLIRNAVDARLERTRDESLYRRLLALPPAAQADAVDASPGQAGGQLQSLRAGLAADRASRAELAATLGPNNPRVVALQAEIDSLDASLTRARQSVLSNLRVRFLTDRANQDANDAALAATLAKVNNEAPDTAEYHELLRQFSLTRFLYTDLYTRLRTASIDAGLGSLKVEVLDPARPSLRPLPTDAAVDAAALTLSGFLLGCLIALVLQNFGLGLRTIEEVEDITDLPSLATLPRLGNLESPARHSPRESSSLVHNLPVLSDPFSQFAEGMRILRTNLAMSGTGEEPKYILFTSSTPSEGKTTVAGNYALALAERGEPVLLIDADMHRPNIHHRFGFSGRQGLSSVLSGNRTLRDCLQQLPGSPHLDILPAGPVPPAPATLLASPAMLRLLRQAGPLYRHIVIDSPPVMAVTDGIILSQLVDAVVYVVRYGKVDRRVVRRGRDLLATSGAPLAGVVFNGLLLRDSDEWN